MYRDTSEEAKSVQWTGRILEHGEWRKKVKIPKFELDAFDAFAKKLTYFEYLKKGICFIKKIF